MEFFLFVTLAFMALFLLFLSKFFRAPSLMLFAGVIFIVLGLSVIAVGWEPPDAVVNFTREFNYSKVFNYTNVAVDSWRVDNETILNYYNNEVVQDVESQGMGLLLALFGLFLTISGWLDMGAKPR